jgi:hypothetical protein
MQDVLLIAHFTQLPGEKGNNRFQYIAEKINRINTEVEVVTSSFSHTNKSQRNKTETQKGGSCYKLTLLFEPGYSENVCLRRFYNHLQSVYQRRRGLWCDLQQPRYYGSCRRRVVKCGLTNRLL